MSFLTEFFDIAEDTGETAVCCPFPHHTSSGLEYLESRPSAHVNTAEKLFHCKVCGKGYSEAQFIQEILGCKFIDAKRLQRCFDTNEDLGQWDASEAMTEETTAKATAYGISEEVINELHMATPKYTDKLAWPVLMYDHLIDIRVYDPGNTPKVRSRAGCPAGLLIPFDTWRETPLNRLTLICAGEKDMSVARSNGLNAVTITGGEGTLPRVGKMFRDRHVAIVYDNDGAGKLGAKKLAAYLLQYTKHVKVVTGFHEICCVEKEDITDFFTKYHKTKEDLIRYIQATEDYDPEKDPEYSRQYRTVDLLEASKPENLGKMLQSNVQVTAISETTFATPSAIMAEKLKLTTDDKMFQGEIKEWELCEDNVQDILHLIDNNFKEENIQKNIRNLMRILQKEKYVQIKTLERATVFKCYVTDMFETTDTTNTQPMEFTAYSINNKLESGQKYLVTYKIVPHPYKGQQLTMLITAAKQANDSVTEFELNDASKNNLKIIRELTGTIAEKIDLMAEKMKGLLGYDGYNKLITAIDLAYHTALQFNFGAFHNIRGYLDTIVIGESRVGKSSTADCLRKTYGLGTFTSLAGNAATIPGLVGGSNKTPNGYQTRAGIIPQNHRGLIIFEEFGKSNNSVIKELTDIRSSNEVRITRVAGNITLPAIVRMIALTNPKTINGQIKSIASYPNGIAILTELVDTAEDIARYDMIVIMSDMADKSIDPLWIPQEPFSEDVYKTRVRWVWSRTSEQIVIDQEVSLYIVEKSNELNRAFECHIKIFGTEAWKKLCRLSIAVAGYLVSTDDSYEKIIVTKEHVDYAIEFMKNLYDNPTFKLREYVQHERQYSRIDQDGVDLLQDIYDKSPTLVLQLEQAATASKNMLSGATGLSADDLNKALNRLTKGLFIKFAGYDIVPTERFRLGLSKINRGTQVRRLGEEDAQVQMDASGN